MGDRLWVNDHLLLMQLARKIDSSLGRCVRVLSMLSVELMGQTWEGEV